MNNIKHVIVQHPNLQAQLFLYDNGEYSSVQMAEDNNYYYYITGKDKINCVGFPNDPYRAIWTKDIADIIVNDLNSKFPEKPVDTETEIGNTESSSDSVSGVTPDDSQTSELSS